MIKKVVVFCLLFCFKGIINLGMWIVFLLNVFIICVDINVCWYCCVCLFFSCFEVKLLIELVVELLVILFKNLGLFKSVFKLFLGIRVI